MREAFEPVLLGLLSAALSLALFDLAAFHVFAATARHFDVAVRVAIHSFSSPSLTASSSCVTWLGSTVVLAAMALALFLFLRRRVARYRALLPLLAIACAELVAQLAKFIVRRVRPHPWFGLHDPQTWSFPSGHSLDSTVCYVVFAVALVPLIGSRSWRIALVFLAIALPLAIGLTRVYLGVHWPTDVLAGWIAGCCVAAGLIRSSQAKPATR